jgi:hypothetical protein
MQNTITQSDIDQLIAKSQITVKSVFGKCTIVSVQLPNGFIMVESSASVDAMNYNEVQGMNICIQKIKDRLWELEGYRLQCELAGGK